MSQSNVLSLLNKLEGFASTKDIKNLAKKEYPNSTLHTYVLDRLRKLEKWGIVKSEYVEGMTFWKVIDNVEHQPNFKLGELHEKK